VLSAETVDAEAGVLSDPVQTSSSILTRVGGAVVGVGQAISTFVTFSAEASVRAVGILTGGAIAAR